MTVSAGAAVQVGSGGGGGGGGGGNQQGGSGGFGGANVLPAGGAPDERDQAAGETPVNRVGSGSTAVAGLPLGAIIGIVIGAAVLLAVVAAAVARKRRQQGGAEAGAPRT